MITSMTIWNILIKKFGYVELFGDNKGWLPDGRHIHDVVEAEFAYLELFG